MRTLTRIGFGIVLTVGAAACVSAQGTNNPPNTNDQSAELLEETRLMSLQVEEKPTERSEDLLLVTQISDLALEQDYAFAEVEGDDPCLLPENTALPQCEQSALSALATDMTKLSASEVALKELQAIVPDVIDPDSFDADRTANEIGRSGRNLQSQVSMALGTEFLMPQTDVEPEARPEPQIELDPANLEFLNRLPGGPPVPPARPTQ